jgi:hypothetical protein
MMIIINGFNDTSSTSLIEMSCSAAYGVTKASAWCTVFSLSVKMALRVRRGSSLGVLAAAAFLLLSAEIVLAQQHSVDVKSNIGSAYHGFIRRFGNKLVDEDCHEYYINGWNS